MNAHRFRGTVAREWNRGPRTGAPVLPGTYTLRLQAGATVAEQRLEVRPDPRATWTADDYVARNDFVAQLNAEYSALDRALNTLDALRRRAAPAVRARIDATSRRLSSHPLNSEDQLQHPDGPRERLATVVGTVALSQGPPSAAHRREAAVVRAADADALAADAQFMQSDAFDRSALHPQSLTRALK